MRFALIDKKLTEAAPNLRGLCPGCSQPVTAKCGRERIHHWAHLSKRNCDNWWEQETEWHRSWKNNFPTDWQEFYLRDERTGEKHMADVRTSDGLVIEFQHSHIDQKERTAREGFYQNMVWIVDGTRLKGDYQRFLKAKKNYSIPMKINGFFRIDHRVDCFPSSWVESSVPVIFDFLANENPESVTDIKNDLYCLFPARLGLDSIFVEVPRKLFLEAAINNRWSTWVANVIEKINRGDLEQEHHQRAEQPIKKRKIIFRRESPYFLDRRGRLRRRWRF